jgi:hypothetical protein
VMETTELERAVRQKHSGAVHLRCVDERMVAAAKGTPEVSQLGPGHGRGVSNT